MGGGMDADIGEDLQAQKQQQWWIEVILLINPIANKAASEHIDMLVNLGKSITRSSMNLM